MRPGEEKVEGEAFELWKTVADIFQEWGQDQQLNSNNKGNSNNNKH